MWAGRSDDQCADPRWIGQVAWQLLAVGLPSLIPPAGARGRCEPGNTLLPPPAASPPGWLVGGCQKPSAAAPPVCAATELPSTPVWVHSCPAPPPGLAAHPAKGAAPRGSGGPVNHGVRAREGWEPTEDVGARLWGRCRLGPRTSTASSAPSGLFLPGPSSPAWPSPPTRSACESHYL